MQLTHTQCPPQSEHMSSSLSKVQSVSDVVSLLRIQPNESAFSTNIKVIFHLRICLWLLHHLFKYLCLSRWLSPCVQLHLHSDPHSQPNVPDWFLFSTLEQKQMTYQYIWNLLLSFRFFGQSTKSLASLLSFTEMAGCFTWLPKGQSYLTLSRWANINFCNSEARALLMTTKCIGLQINSAQPEAILNVSFKFKTETSEKIISLLLRGHWSPSSSYFLGREENSISLPKREMFLSFLSFIHSLRAKGWIIRLAGMEEGTECVSPSPFQQIQACFPSLPLPGTACRTLCGHKLVRLMEKQLGNLITASSLSHVFQSAISNPKANIHLSYLIHLSIWFRI